MDLFSEGVPSTVLFCHPKTKEAQKQKIFVRAKIPFLAFRETFSVVRKLIFICGEHLCSAIFKKGSAMSVSSRKLEKNVIELI